jgi:hypothetical protein
LATLRILNSDEIATIGAKSALTRDENRRHEVDWLYNDANAREQVRNGRTVVTSMGKTWEVLYRGNRVIYHQVGSLVPMGNVKRDRFEEKHYVDQS